MAGAGLDLGPARAGPARSCGRPGDAHDSFGRARKTRCGCVPPTLRSGRNPDCAHRATPPDTLSAARRDFRAPAAQESAPTAAPAPKPSVSATGSKEFDIPDFLKRGRL